MKVARFFAVIFAVIGIVLMLGTAVVCFASLDSSVKILENPSGAVACSEELMQAVNEGDYAKVGSLLYGNPELGADSTPTETSAALLWDAFVQSLSFEYTGKLYLLDADLARDATVTALDVASVISAVPERTRLLLEAKVADAEQMEELYDEDGQFQEALVEQVLQEALQTAIREDGKTITKQITVKLVFRNGQWWAVPDHAFLKLLSGFGE